jgi:SAM-dependent methyltransferase
VQVSPNDAEARRERLERWGVDQKRRIATDKWRDRRPGGFRLWTKVGLARAQIALGAASARLLDRVLDRGLDTSGKSNEPEHSHPDRQIYLPSPWYALPRELRYLGVTNEDTFVDFGCGKGRVVHQAAKWPFRRVVGVEISPALAEIARAALAARSHQHRCQAVEIVVADAAEFRVPDDVTIAYLFHPFRGETLNAVLRGIIDSIDRQPRCVRLIYVYPLAGEDVLATGRFRLLKERRAVSRYAPFSSSAVFESC